MKKNYYVGPHRMHNIYLVYTEFMQFVDKFYTFEAAAACLKKNPRYIMMEGFETR